MNLRRFYSRLITHKIQWGREGTWYFQLLMLSLNLLKSKIPYVPGGGGSRDIYFLGEGGSGVIPTFDVESKPKFPISRKGGGVRHLRDFGKNYKILTTIFSPTQTDRIKSVTIALHSSTLFVQNTCSKIIGWNYADTTILLSSLDITSYQCFCI